MAWGRSGAGARAFASPPPPIAPPSCIQGLILPLHLNLQRALCVDPLFQPLPLLLGRDRARLIDRIRAVWAASSAVSHAAAHSRAASTAGLHQYPGYPGLVVVLVVRVLRFICLSRAVGVAEPFAVCRRPCEQCLWRWVDLGRAWSGHLGGRAWEVFRILMFPVCGRARGCRGDFADVLCRLRLGAPVPVDGPDHTA